MKLVYTAFVLTFLSHSLASGQQTPSLPPVNLADFVNRGPQLCEDRSAGVDVITQRTPANEPIIVIARLGKGETRPNLSWRRLHNVRAYWTQYRGRKQETIILAEGQRVPSYGRLEFYVGGKLVWVLEIHRNADVDFADCVPPDESYIRHGVFNPCWVKDHRIFFPCREMYRKRDHENH